MTEDHNTLLNDIVEDVKSEALSVGSRGIYGW